MSIIKRYKTFFVLTIVFCFTVSSGCQTAKIQKLHNSKFYRDTSAIDYSDITFTAWEPDNLKTITDTAKKEYTVMIYINGSDLERENGAATLDIREMIESGADFERLNVVLFTGGTLFWHNDVIPPYVCALWNVDSSGLHHIADAGQLNMGDPGTLAGFIKFARSYYPADKYGLILWDHGGGSIAGYGHDEVFNNSRLTLLELDYALNDALGDGEKLEFIGFDACLMASVEMAVVASSYAQYMIASEDLEPGDGWDYRFMQVFAQRGTPNGKQVGDAVCSSYMQYYGYLSREPLTMSVTYLENAEVLMGELGALMSKCTHALLEDRVGLSSLSKRRAGTKTFGEGSAADNDCDMVDIGDMVNRLRDIFPQEAENVLKTLQRTVAANVHNSRANLSGLSAFYIYGGKDDAANTLRTYESLKMSREYTQYLQLFAENLTEVSVQWRRDGVTEFLDQEYRTLWSAASRDGYYELLTRYDFTDTGSVLTTRCEDRLYPALCGEFVCLDKIADTETCELFAIPILYNGEPADVVVQLCGFSDATQILGIRREDGYVVQKGYDDVHPGDKISIVRRVRSFTESYDEFKAGKEFVVTDGLEFQWLSPGIETIYVCTMRIDTRLNEHYFEMSAL